MSLSALGIFLKETDSWEIFLSPSHYYCTPPLPPASWGPGQWGHSSLKLRKFIMLKRERTHLSSQRLISMQSGCFPQNLPYLFSLCLEGRRPVKKLNPLQPSLSALGRYGWDTGVVRKCPKACWARWQGYQRAVRLCEHKQRRIYWDCVKLLWVSVTLVQNSDGIQVLLMQGVFKVHDECWKKTFENFVNGKPRFLASLEKPKALTCLGLCINMATFYLDFPMECLLRLEMSSLVFNHFY